MPKRFKHQYSRTPPLDLHGLKYTEVYQLVENYVLINQHNCPLKIITGNSDKMKSIVTDVLKTHGFKYSAGDYYNRGYIDVLN